MPAAPISIAIADDHTLFRKLLSEFLSKQNDIIVLIEAGDALELLDKLSHTPVDVVLLDLYMPKMSGIDATTIISNEFPGIKIIIVSLCTDYNIIKGLLELGIYAYLAKTEDPQNILEAIHSAARNTIHRNPLYTEALYLDKEDEIKKMRTGVNVNLDEREKKIINLLWEDKNNKEIADLVYLSISSVEKIKQELKDKLEARSIAGIFKYALKHGIISLSDVRLGQAKETIKR